MEPLKIIINGMFTTEPITEPLVFWMQQIGLKTEIQCAPYNQLFHQLLDPDSLTNSNTNGFNIILLRLEEWERKPERAIENVPLSVAAKRSLEHNTQELVLTLKLVATQIKSKLLICSCPGSPQLLNDSVRVELYNQLEKEIESEIKYFSNFSFISSKELLSNYPADDYYDDITQELGNIPYTETFFATIATFLARKIHFLLKPPCRAIILDYPYTLWLSRLQTNAQATIEKQFYTLHKFLEKQYKLDRKLAITSDLPKEKLLENFYQNPQLLLNQDMFMGWECNSLPLNIKLVNLCSLLQATNEQIVYMTCQQENYNTAVTEGMPCVKLPDSEWGSFLYGHWSFD